MIAKKIRALIGYEGITQAELAKRLGKTPQNLYGQLSRDNFSERELEEIAKQSDIFRYPRNPAPIAMFTKIIICCCASMYLPYKTAPIISIRYTAVAAV